MVGEHGYTNTKDWTVLSNVLERMFRTHNIDNAHSKVLPNLPRRRTPKLPRPISLPTLKLGPTIITSEPFVPVAPPLLCEEECIATPNADTHTDTQTR